MHRADNQLKIDCAHTTQMNALCEWGHRVYVELCFDDCNVQ